MEFSYSLHGETLVITPEFERIDASVAIRFKDEMRKLTDGARGRVVLDLEPIAFVDSSGLGAVVAVMKQLGGTKRLELANLQPTVAKVFRLTRMDSVFTIHTSIASALAPPATQAV